MITLHYIILCLLFACFIPDLLVNMPSLSNGGQCGISQNFFSPQITEHGEYRLVHACYQSTMGVVGLKAACDLPDTLSPSVARSSHRTVGKCCLATLSDVPANLAGTKAGRGGEPDQPLKIGIELTSPCAYEHGSHVLLLI